MERWRGFVSTIQVLLSASSTLALKAEHDMPLEMNKWKLSPKLLDSYFFMEKKIQ